MQSPDRHVDSVRVQIQKMTAVDSSIYCAARVDCSIRCACIHCGIRIDCGNPIGFTTRIGCDIDCAIGIYCSIGCGVGSRHVD